MKSWRELSAEEFYSRRDERTVTLLEADRLRSARLKLSIDDGEAETFNGQVSYLLMANLNARWCRQIQFIVRPVPLHPLLRTFGSTDLLSASLQIAHAADPFGAFTPGSQAIKGSDAPISCIQVGRHDAGDSFRVIGRGWLAAAGPRVDDLDIAMEDENPLGAVLAGCIGTCYAMRNALGLQPMLRQAKLSLWNLEDGDAAANGPILGGVALGRVLIVGAGAIGGAVTYLLPLIRPQLDSLVLVDGDFVDYPNLNRVPIFVADDVGQPKVNVVGRHLHGWGIEAQPVHCWFDGGKISLGDFDLLIPAANERGVRESIMSNIPPLMISASTGAQWDAYRQRHIPVVDDCLSCRFPSPKQTAKLACSTGPVERDSANGAPPETGALPFLSVAGAVMALSEVTKLAYEPYPRDGNFSTIWFSSQRLRFTNAEKQSRTGCPYCVDREVFQQLRPSGRFAALAQSDSE